MLAMLALIYWQTVVYSTRQTDETIDAEITGLAEQYRERGLAGLVAVINERSNPERGSSMLYLLTDQRQRPLAGNLSRWPDLEVEKDGWMRFRLSDGTRRGDGPHIAQATTFVLAGGVQLLVGRDLAESVTFRNRIIVALGSSGALTLLLGLVGGIGLSRRALARIDAINRTGDLIRAGEFSHRIPLKGSGDEFDRLAQNLNAMLDQIERLMAGMRQVTDNIAHDLRSPLGRLRSRIEMALIEEPSTERYREVLQQTIAEAEAGSPHTQMAPLDLAAFARDLVDLYEPAAEEKGLRLTLEHDSGAKAAPVEAMPLGEAAALEVRGDRHMLSRAVANLVENALKYTPAGGTVAIRVGRNGTMAQLAVGDDGPGIPAAERERVFDRFYRLEASRTTEGNGLGLSLARAVVRLHGGAITLEDNHPGLVAVVSLPLAS